MDLDAVGGNLSITGTVAAVLALVFFLSGDTAGGVLFGAIAAVLLGVALVLAVR
jgi:hypothetical protein